MRFRTRLMALVAGMIALIIVLLFGGWWASGRLLDATDFAYQQGLKLTQIVDMAREAQIAFQRQVQEWKNVLIRGSDPELRNKHWQGFEAQEAKMDKMLQSLSSNLSTLSMEEPTKEVKKTIAEHKLLGERYRKALDKQAVLDAKAQAAIDLEVRGMDRPTSAGIDSLVADLQKRVAQRFGDEAATVRSNTSNQVFTAALVTLLLTGLLVAVAVALSHSVLTALGADPEDAVTATSRMARGDLTERLNAKTPSSLIGALEMMQSRLRNISLAIRTVADDITTRANGLSQTGERDALLADVGRLRDAIGRIRIDREAGKSS
ncbi:MAG: hypothetical protein WBQ05_01830 [Candidatus Competibacter denitrificans]